LCVSPVALPADAPPLYTYTVIADLSNCFNFGGTALNNLGEVAFGANCGTPIGPPSGSVVVRRGNGGPLADIFTAGSSGVPHTDVLSMNDSGVVAFAVNTSCPSGGAAAIWTGDGGAVATVVDICTDPQYTAVLRPSINNDGAIAFMADTDGVEGYDSVIRASGGTFVTIAGPGKATTSVGPLTAAIEPAINNNGVVTLTGQGVSAYGIYTGTGGPLTTISVDNPSTFNGINDSGRVPFTANSVAVKTGNGGKPTTIAEAGSAGFHVFTGGGAAINNSNVVAFWAQTTGGSGVFVGDGVITQPVVEVGDVIPQLGTVTWVGISEEAINDSGQVALMVQYNDGENLKFAIVRADPILPQITQLKFNATVAGCKNVTVTVALDRPTPPGGVEIEVDDTIPAASAPASVKIASNKTAGKFVVSTVPVPSKQTGTITATLGSSNASKALSVRPIGVQSVTLNPNTVVGGSTVSGWVTLECAAAPNDITVTLSSTNPSIAQPSVPTLLFPAGTKTKTFGVNTSPVATPSTATIKAAANGITKNKKLTINP
jgi:hypothetical protein